MNNTARRASIALGIFMAVVLVAGAILPIFSQNTTTEQTVQPTDAPIPTFPPPPADFATTMSFDELYLHPTGIFAIAQPEGWTATEPNKGPYIAQVNLVNNAVLGVVDSYVEQSLTGITTAELTDHFTEDAINQSWARFQRWEETNRELVDDRLVIDFNVTLNQQTYVARQVAWTDGLWIYVVRVLAPSNAVDFLRYMLEGVADSMLAFTEFQGTPLDWNAYYDEAEQHIIRYPAAWEVTDTAPGRPTSITGGGGELLRVEAREGVNIPDEAAATEFVTGERINAEVTSVEAVERGLASGFSVAYQTRTVDGALQSGLMVLLNDENTLHIADLRYPEGGIDFNQIEAPTLTAAQETPEPALDAEATELPGLLAVEEPAENPVYINLAQVMRTFQVIAALPLATEPVPTPIPTFAPTLAPTEEVTDEAAATPEADATETVDDAIAIPTEAATAEATDEG